MDKATRILPIPLTSASYPESMDDLLDTISFHWRDSIERQIQIQIFERSELEFGVRVRSRIGMSEIRGLAAFATATAKL